MTDRLAVTLSLVAGLAMLVAAPTLAATAGAPVTASNHTNGSAGLGADISAFMQASTVGANDSVDAGMWAAEFNRTGQANRTDMVLARTGSLSERLTATQERIDELRQARDNGTISQVAYAARVGRLSARVDSLQRALNGTATAADRAGVNTSRLDSLRESARNLSGQEVAALARNLSSVGPPEDVERGPPDDRGPDRGDEADGEEDADDDTPAARGPQGNASERNVTTGPVVDGPDREGDTPEDVGRDADRPDPPGGDENAERESDEGNENRGTASEGHQPPQRPADRGPQADNGNDRPDAAPPERIDDEGDDERDGDGDE